MCFFVFFIFFFFLGVETNSQPATKLSTNLWHKSPNKTLKYIKENNNSNYNKENLQSTATATGMEQANDHTSKNNNNNNNHKKHQHHYGHQNDHQRVSSDTNEKIHGRMNLNTCLTLKEPPKSHASLSLLGHIRFYSLTQTWLTDLYLTFLGVLCLMPVPLALALAPQPLTTYYTFSLSSS